MRNAIFWSVFLGLAFSAHARSELRHRILCKEGPTYGDFRSIGGINIRNSLQIEYDYSRGIWLEGMNSENYPKYIDNRQGEVEFLMMGQDKDESSPVVTRFGVYRLIHNYFYLRDVLTKLTTLPRLESYIFSKLNYLGVDQAPFDYDRRSDVALIPNFENGNWRYEVKSIRTNASRTALDVSPEHYLAPRILGEGVFGFFWWDRGREILDFRYYNLSTGQDINLSEILSLDKKDAVVDVRSFRNDIYLIKVRRVDRMELWAINTSERRSQLIDLPENIRLKTEFKIDVAENEELILVSKKELYGGRLAITSVSGHEVFKFEISDYYQFPKEVVEKQDGLSRPGMARISSIRSFSGVYLAIEEQANKHLYFYSKQKLRKITDGGCENFDMIEETYN